MQFITGVVGERGGPQLFGQHAVHSNWGKAKTILQHQ